MPIPVAELQTEITNDPTGRGYAPFVSSGSDAKIAQLLNTTRANVSDVFRSSVPASDILGCIVWAEVGALTTNALLWLEILLLPGTVDARNARIRQMFNGIFPVGTFPLTNAALAAIAKRPAPTRAEELWGEGTVVSDVDVARALGRIG